MMASPRFSGIPVDQFSGGRFGGIPIEGQETTADVPATVNPNLRAQGLRMEDARSGLEFISQRDPGIDYSTGVNNATFRAGFSRMSNDAEKSNYLNRTIGKDKWGTDSFGAY